MENLENLEKKLEEVREEVAELKREKNIVERRKVKNKLILGIEGIIWIFIFAFFAISLYVSTFINPEYYVGFYIWFESLFLSIIIMIIVALIHLLGYVVNLIVGIIKSNRRFKGRIIIKEQKMKTILLIIVVVGLGSLSGFLIAQNIVLQNFYNSTRSELEEINEDYDNLNTLYLEMTYENNRMRDNTAFSGHFYTPIEYKVNHDRNVRSIYIYTSYEVYFYYRLEMAHFNYHGSNHKDAINALANYCTPEEPNITSIAQTIKSNCINPNDDEEVINALLSLCQSRGNGSRSIVYNTDGKDDFAKYPLETIAEGNGDCEDKSILFASLVEVLGYDAILILSETSVEGINHVFVGVSLDSGPKHNLYYPTSWYVDVNGVKYYTCETTSDGWLIGDLGVEYQAKGIWYSEID